MKVVIYSHFWIKVVIYSPFWRARPQKLTRIHSWRASASVGFGVWGVGFMVWDLEFGVWEFGVWGLGFRVQGFVFCIVGVRRRVQGVSSCFPIEVRLSGFSSIEVGAGALSYERGIPIPASCMTQTPPRIPKAYR